MRNLTRVIGCAVLVGAMAIPTAAFAGMIDTPTDSYLPKVTSSGEAQYDHPTFVAQKSVAGADFATLYPDFVGHKDVWGGGYAKVHAGFVEAAKLYAGFVERTHQYTDGYAPFIQQTTPTAWGTGNAKLHAGLVEPTRATAWMCVPAKSIVQGAYWVTGMAGSTIGTLDPSTNKIAENVPAKMMLSFGQSGSDLRGVWVTTPEGVPTE